MRNIARAVWYVTRTQICGVSSGRGYLSVAVWQIIPQCTASTKTTICCLSISEGQESGENLPELSGFVVSGELGISCPPGQWRSEGSTEDLCWQRFTHYDWPLPRLLRVSAGRWCEASSCSARGLFRRAAQAMSTGFPCQDKWSARERKRLSKRQKGQGLL